MTICELLLSVRAGIGNENEKLYCNLTLTQHPGDGTVAHEPDPLDGVPPNAIVDVSLTGSSGTFDKMYVRINAGHV